MNHALHSLVRRAYLLNKPNLVATHLPRALCNMSTSSAPNQTKAEAGRSGLAVDESTASAAFKKQQEMRGPEAYPSMTAPQSEMKTKPDCGEESYVGAGKLKGKVVLITGGDSGIGRAAAIACAREGADVAIAFHSHDDDANDTMRYVEGAGQRCLLLKCDVSDKNQCRDIVQRTVRELGKLDCLINNAGIQYNEDSLDDANDHLEQVFATNVFSCFWLAAEALKHMKEHAGCTIIQNTSINAFKGNASLVSYTATKGAMQAFTRSLALKYAEKGIRVNAVAPGPIWTPFITGTNDPDKNAEFGSQTLLKRAGQPVECAPAFVFLASADSSFITGNTIHVDGGQFTSS